MLKYLLATIRWGKLSPEDRNKVKSLSLKEIFNSAYLTRNYYG